MEQTIIPEYPFGTEDFSPAGGGLDFLGLRVVNLRILSEDLLPGINNATQDVGSFILGTWLPWKFRALCSSEADFTQDCYDRFSEAMHVAIAFSQRDGSPAEVKFGRANQRIGVDQQITFPSELAFAAVGRTNATSLFAAPLYGPSLRSLGLHRGFAEGRNRKQTEIHIADDKPDAIIIAEFTDNRLRRSKEYLNVVRLAPPRASAEQLDDLGMHGLHPACYRDMSAAVRAAFAGRLLPRKTSGDWNARTLSAALIVQTVRQSPGITTKELRSVWHTGKISGGALEIVGDAVQQHAELWAIFMARQYQRYCLELFMHCFEASLAEGSRTVRECADQLGGHFTSGYKKPDSLRAACQIEAAKAGIVGEIEELSEGWRKKVDSNSEHYDWGSDLLAAPRIVRAISMLARWYLRTFANLRVWERHLQTNWDGQERVSIAWFTRWLGERLDVPIDRLVEELLTQFVFSQHLRVAMGRFDGRDVQRLRFSLDDAGIVRTPAVAATPALEPNLMADRLDAFVNLLNDLCIVDVDQDARIVVGSNASFVPI